MSALVCVIITRRAHRGSGWALVGLPDFNSVGPGPAVGTVGSTPSRSRHLYYGIDVSIRRGSNRWILIDIF